MTKTSELPKHVLSITNPIAKHDYACAWHRNVFDSDRTINKGDVYVRVVWESDQGDVNSDHICVDCWAK